MIKIKFISLFKNSGCKIKTYLQNFMSDGKLTSAESLSNSQTHIPGFIVDSNFKSYPTRKNRDLIYS